MTTRTSSAAMATAMAYHKAWTAKDIDGAMAHIADNVICDAPGGRIAGREAYRAFLAGFAQQVTSADMIEAFGDDESAVLLYDPHTALVESAPTAEHFQVAGGKIVRSRLIFDRAPFIAARSATS